MGVPGALAANVAEPRALHRPRSHTLHCHFCRHAAFFKWLSAKYPKVIVDVMEERPTWTDDGVRVPVDTSRANPNGMEFDNLYLDMNGIIHPASHPEDGPPPETEDDMYLAIFDYLERVFAAVRPRRLLFMAIDGVAPRAKMNQQRARRFRSAQEAQEKEEEETRLREEWAKEGREVPPRKENLFDSNVITPGTPFMDRLALFLRTFVHCKLSTDPGWAGIEVILSDGSVPGEGEHKIMEYIRSQRRQPGYDPDTRHALHGLDADLIMLSLATHEPHFCILREYVGPASGKGKGGSLSDQIEAEMQQRAAAEAEGREALVEGNFASGRQGKEAGNPTPFQFLQIATLREYLQIEFANTIDYACVGGFDLERVIDDFIFLCFFVGNDFLPHLPSLDIRLGAIDTLVDLYKACFPKMGGWVCDGGRVHLGRAKIFCTELSLIEDELLQKHRSAEERDKDKRRRRDSDVKNKEACRKHREMMQRVSDFAQVPRASAHLQALHGGPGSAKGGESGGHDAATYQRSAELALGRDASLLELFNQIQEFAQLPDDAPPCKLPSHLNSYQRAMAMQMCDELTVANKRQGADANLEIWLVKQGNGANESAAARFKRELDAMVKKRNTFDEAEEDTVQLGVPGWKERYYARKFAGLGDGAHTDIAKAYAEGLCWVMRYYYEGCCSWGWFFPYHYAPFATDIAEAIDPDEPFEPELGTPFLPFEQLMAVLPPRSASALPNALAEIMRDPSSELADCYPVDFQIDLNGKKFAWQAVVLLPFIEEERLLATIQEYAGEFSAEEQRRNSHGKPMLFVRDGHPLFAPLVKCYGPPPSAVQLTADIPRAFLSGCVTCLEDAPPPHKLLEPPAFHGLEVGRALKDFVNLAVRATFALPPAEATPSRPTLLANVKMPEPRLTRADAPVIKQGSFVTARRMGGEAQRMIGHHLPARQGSSSSSYGGHGHDYRRAEGDAAPVDEARVHALLAQRLAARVGRQFTDADRLRDELRAMGVEIDDRVKTWRVARAATMPVLPRPPHHAPPYPPPQSAQYPVAPAPHPAYAQYYSSGPMLHPPGAPGHAAYAAYQQYPAHQQPLLPPPPSHPAPYPSSAGGPAPQGRHDNRYHPYGIPPSRDARGDQGAPGGVGSAASLLRQQIALNGGARPPPPAGAPTDLNRSAAELLRQQLKRK
jgi:5'-3' exonuclease